VKEITSEGFQAMAHRGLTSGGLAAAAVAAALIATGGAPEPSQAAPPDTLVALGDSYASGVGTRAYYRASGPCKRSPYAYPVRDARRLDLRLKFVACAGATTASVRNDQVGALTAATDYVTVTVGGNDIGFADVITACAPPWWASDCFGAIDEAEDEMRHVLPGRLNRLYRLIRARAPDAHVVVVGYPRLFMGEDCNAGTWFSPREQARLNAAANLLARRIRGRATAHGFSYADPRAAYTGHAICDEVEWVNGLSHPLAESYHPNRAGQAGYARLVRNQLT
jgi:hypothetical protein